MVASFLLSVDWNFPSSLEALIKFYKIIYVYTYYFYILYFGKKIVNYSIH
jgi:hypothetical protein